MKPSARGLPLGGALLFKLAIGLLALFGEGFHGVSDDDFARVFIAQGFATAPSLDPSGTSWLPFPFWLTGSAMLAFGKSLFVARIVAVLCGLLSTALLYLAARQLKLSPLRSASAAALGSTFPYAAYLGVATVPESLCAASIVAACVLVSSSPRLRLFGGALLCSACLSRYEAWPVALGFALVSGWDAFRGRSEVNTEPFSKPQRTLLLGSGALAVSGSLWWMLHGLYAQGSATFFVDRVAAYRRAIGAAPESLWARLSGYPLGFLRGEPELVLVTFVFSAWLFSSLRRSQSPEPPPSDSSGVRSSVSQPWRRTAALLLLMLLSLIYGDLRDGAPTHHSERAVLALWMFTALVLLRVLELLLAHTSKPRIVLVAVACLLLGQFVLRPWYSRRDSFIIRRAAVATGAAAKSKGAEKLAVATDDFGFYAVCVGFEAPDACFSLRDNDPRKKLTEDPLGSVSALRKALDAKGARWFALPVKYRELGERLGTERFVTGGWVLFEAGEPLR
ncbi:MAG: glycosyltransferase family 39 protein [Polyangiaceae bacterium]|nr:glycosyltransferase family 39 protein [Myxococcales bacterium]MCB9585034.1 glycosyltransferase family 39 protein [Polyangiaceae bacterium]MCB9610075.1 glycosyltransferase family 39 protein [Polyangiaceae bacterium]